MSDVNRRAFLAAGGITLVSMSAGRLRGSAPPDPRDIRNGFVIPHGSGYVDLPYVVVTDGGQWLCIVTRSPTTEGATGQHVVSFISGDQGRSWSEPVEVEPRGGPEATNGMPLKVPSGRVYVFYAYNRDNIRMVPNAESGAKRVDCIGSYMFRYSDDGGRTWSRDRYEIPMRPMRIDRTNNFGGKTLIFFGVGKPLLHGPVGYFGFCKVGKWGLPGTLVTSQACLMSSDNIAAEKDPSRIRWKTLPDGEEGLRAPKGPAAEEPSIVPLSDGSLYVVYRTIDGYSCHAYSRDGGHSWTGPEYTCYSPGGRRVKHPRAASFVWKTRGGRYLLWYHNHGGEPAQYEGKSHYYQNRNPVWIAGGWERAGRMHWSEPEILLYDENPATRISYPDFIEDKGRFFVTESQKTIARVHEVDPDLLDGLWNQADRKRVTRNGLTLELAAGQTGAVSTVPMVPFAALTSGTGFTLEFWVRFSELTPGQILLDTRQPSGRGIQVTTSDRWALQLAMSDGQNAAIWESDPGTHPGTLRVGFWHHVAVIVDAGPKLIMFVIDGTLNDGGPLREYGWGRFPQNLGDVNGSGTMTVAGRLFGELRGLRVYNRALRVSEAIGNFRAGM